MDNKELAKHLKKFKVVLDHLEKIILALALVALAVFAGLKLMKLKEDEKAVEAKRPAAKKVIPVGGLPVGEIQMSPFYAALDASTNTNRTPVLQLGKGIGNHFLFHPDQWMSNQGHGVFRADDGERKMGIDALRVVRLPYYTNLLMVRPELRLSAPGAPPRDHFLTVRAQHIRYQTTNGALFSNRLLHPFLPTTNIVLYSPPNLFRHTLPAGFLDMTAVGKAGFTNHVRWDDFQMTRPLLPPRDKDNIVLRHRRPDVAQRLPNPGMDPLSHPEKIIARYLAYTNANNAHWCQFDIYLHGQTNAVRFKDAPWLRPHILQEREDPGSNTDPRTFTTISWDTFVDLAYVTPNKQVYFQACTTGRKFFLDGEFFVLEKINSDHVVFGKDPDLTPESDPSRDRKYPIPFAQNLAMGVQPAARAP
ncbi:MAG: hypothetical protein EXS28_11535 [Pedosphaera sp.]|nr:hypothetical protein [Pedosphaera sp.]